MTPEQPDDDKCQISICNRTHFTYCPHCKLFVCIEHLNEHYANYKEEYKLLLENADREQSFYQAIIEKISTEKSRWMDFFDSQLSFFESSYEYFKRKSQQERIRPHDCSELQSRICKSSEKRAKIRNFIEQGQTSMDEFCQESPNDDLDGASVIVKREKIATTKISRSSPMAQFSIDFEEIDDDPAAEEANSDHFTSRNSSSIPTSDDSKHSSQSMALQYNNKEYSEMSTDSNYEEFSDQEHDSDSDPDFGAMLRKNTSRISDKKKSLPPRSAVNRFQVDVCPLLDKLYGINLEKHQLHNVPCTRSNINSISLFTHLRIFHCLSSFASLRLVRHIMANGYQKDFDLFSTATEPLVNILSKSLRGRCPLTRLGVFGLNRFHDIRLCDPRQTRADTGLLNHFVIYHHLSYPWANKLCNAMRAGDQDGTKQTLFKSDEPIKAEKWLNKQAKNILGKRSSREKTDRQDMMNRSLT